MKVETWVGLAVVLMMATPVLGARTASALPTLTADDASVVEADTTSVWLVFTLHLSEPAKGVRVQYTIAGETASGWADYKPISGRVDFRGSSLTQTVSVEIFGDTLVEGSETVRLVLSNVRGATLGTSSAVGTIVDNDV